MKGPELWHECIGGEGEDEEDVWDGAADGVGQRVQDVQGFLVLALRAEAEGLVQELLAVAGNASKSDADVVEVERRDAVLRRQLDAPVRKHPLEGSVNKKSIY